MRRCLVAALVAAVTGTACIAGVSGSSTGATHGSSEASPHTVQSNSHPRHYAGVTFTRSGAAATPTKAVAAGPSLALKRPTVSPSPVPNEAASQDAVPGLAAQCVELGGGSNVKMPCRVP